MCAVSFVGTYWANTFHQRYPDMQPMQPIGGYTYIATSNPVSQEQFENLRKEVAELKVLLLAAKKFDDATGQHDCEQEEKVALIRSVAKMVGVDLTEIFPNEKGTD